MKPRYTPNSTHAICMWLLILSCTASKWDTTTTRHVPHITLYATEQVPQEMSNRSQSRTHRKQWFWVFWDFLGFHHRNHTMHFVTIMLSFRFWTQWTPRRRHSEHFWARTSKRTFWESQVKGQITLSYLKIVLAPAYVHGSGWNFAGSVPPVPATYGVSGIKIGRPPQLERPFSLMFRRQWGYGQQKTFVGVEAGYRTVYWTLSRNKNERSSEWKEKKSRKRI